MTKPKELWPRRGTADTPKMGPVMNLRTVREALYVDKSGLATKLTEATRHIKSAVPLKDGTIPPPQAIDIFPSRMSEWEANTRPIPEYVYIAAARAISEQWEREKTGLHKTEQVCQIDIKFATVLNPAFGAMYRSAVEALTLPHPEAVLRLLSEIEDAFLVSFTACYGEDNLLLKKRIRIPA